VLDGRESDAAVCLADAAELYERKGASAAVDAVREQLAALLSSTSQG